MEKIGIIVKPAGNEIRSVTETLIGWLSEKKKKIYLDKSALSLFNGPVAVNAGRLDPKSVDLIIVLGGDGTLLSAARMIEENEVPILGVNQGGLGFLTETTQEDLYATLEKLFQGDYVLDERIMLKSEVSRQGKAIAHSMVLNDVIINKGTLAKMITLEIYSDGQFLSSLRGDGLIVSTPTGSTAYSLSAGGPILYPSIDALMLTPICPHTLTQRPIVLPSAMKVEVILKSREDGAMATFDGQVGFSLRHEDQIHIETGKIKTRLVRSPGVSYFEVLRNKLHWGAGKNR